MRYLPPNTERNLGELGHVGGFPIDVTARTSLGRVHIIAELSGVPGASITVPRDQFVDARVGLVRQLENRAASLPKLLTDTQQKRVETATTITEVDARIGDQFKHGDELREAHTRQVRVATALAAMADDQNPRTETPSEPATGISDEQVAGRDRVKELTDRARARTVTEDRGTDRDQAPGVRPVSARPQV
ncbi:hypothetical protein RCH23_002270 [Cryobacterium sp. CAN_C3]|uniref:hypothetical protein n=1 Tax=unclassified Cryobacterium TaxID=2649013 RepID=UPI0018C952A8|nr:hypothetical protein [Cryobacterium sp. CAN_C3]MEC5154882.1 hypothetical protein [Cryobacterium sp. CAN_C3]